MNWVLAGQTNMLGRRLATGLTSRPIAAIVPVFTPASLFAGGEQGAWYDPSDLTTMFEDSAGTTAVHTPGNGTADSPVGRILDKSGRGNHATQSTSTARPTLSALYNLLTYTEDFTNGAWSATGVTVTSNSVLAPDGTTTADTLNANAGGGQHNLQRLSTNPAKTVTFSCAFKYNNNQWIGIALFDTAWRTASFDIQNGTLGTAVSAGVTRTLTSLGDGWYRASITYTATTAVYVGIFLLPSDTTTLTFTATGSEKAYIWGADLRLTNDGVGLPVYQKVVDSNTYTSIGFPYYLKSDGVDDSLSTSAINFSGSNKLCSFISIRKLINMTDSEFVSISTNYFTNNGTFSVGVYPSESNYLVNAKGTAVSSVSLSSYATPITNIITSTFDIGAPSIIVRVNGSQVGSSSSSLGTGNFGNYSMYISARGGAGNFAGYRAYGIIVRSGACTATEITDTETWLNGKTKAY